MSPFDESTRCHFTTADGRRCRMLRADGHTKFCRAHLRSQRQRMRSDPAAPPLDVLRGLTDLGSAAAVNHALRNITSLVLDNRMDYRKAAVLAYLCQLLLQSISLASRERESGRYGPPPAPVSSPLPAVREHKTPVEARQQILALEASGWNGTSRAPG
jgi:hypothetical protein